MSPHNSDQSHKSLWSLFEVVVLGGILVGRLVFFRSGHVSLPLWSDVSKVSRVVLCTSKVKVLWLSEWVSHLLSCSGQLKKRRKTEDKVGVFKNKAKSWKVRKTKRWKYKKTRTEKRISYVSAVSYSCDVFFLQLLP